MKTILLITLSMMAIVFTPRNEKADPAPVVLSYTPQPFSEQWLEKKLKSLNIRHYKVVIAQAKLESANFTSKIFIENNNLFGMKRAKQRATTSTKTVNGHAYYPSIEDCVLDYAMYYSKYLSNMESENEVIWYLARSYSEDSLYYKKIKKLMR